MRYIGKILPMDGYTVNLNGQLPIDYAISLTHLYQPLIGMDGVMVFQTLLNETNIHARNEKQTHHTLMNYVQQPLDVIYEARLKLEGIGLLRTYKKIVDENTHYTYEVQCPFSPSQFLQDAMLSELLYHHIGKTKFNSLKNILCEKTTRVGEETTASFKDVFQTFQPTFVENEPKDTSDSSLPVSKTYPEIDEKSIRYALARKMIRPERILTEKNKQLIAQMMDVYQLEVVEIGRCLTWSVTDEELLDEGEFKEACEELFITKNRTTKIHLTPKQHAHIEEQKTDKASESIVAPLEVEQEGTQKKTRREIILHEFETMSSAQMLADHSPNGTVSNRDLGVVTDVMNNQGLSVPVMNVLVHYVFIQQNKQLAKNYLETIASHWARVGFTTAEEAMQFAQSVNERYNKAKEKAATKKKNKQTEIIPDWYDEHMKQIEEVERIKEEERKQQKQDMSEEEIEKELDALIRSVSKK